MEKDKIQLNQIGQLTEMSAENKGNDQRQGLKTPNRQPAFNEKISDEDSLFKFLSYSGMLEKKRREEFPKNKQLKTDIAYGIHTFDEFYKGELVLEAKREQKREYKFDPKDYEPKRNPEQKKVQEETEED